MINKIKSINLMVLIGFLGLYLISTGVSWAAFSYLGGVGTSGSGGNNLTGLARERAKIAELPKDKECPINGGMFTKVEEDIWKDRRPLTVVIENHLDARPLSGLSRADVVYEAIAEGGITRLLGVFYCGASSQDFRVAVIRSARIHFINWAAEYGNNPIFVHWGGANTECPTCPGGVKPKGTVAPEVDAYAALYKLGWTNGIYGNDFDGAKATGYPVLQRLANRLSSDPNYTIATEHTPALFIDEAYKEATKREFAYKDENGLAWDEGFESWSFADDAPVGSPEYEKISLEFWSNKSDYDVAWEYDKASNSYKRLNGGKAFVDWEFDNTQVAVKNVVVQFVGERGPVDRELHMFYENISDGDVLVFQNGTVIEGTWEKDTQLGRTKFYGEDEKEIRFVRGQIWIEAVPVGNDIVY